mgnify:CR=1 FL=1
MYTSETEVYFFLVIFLIISSVTLSSSGFSISLMVLGDAVIKVHILNILAAWLCIPIWRVFLYLPLDFWSDIFVHSISVFLDILCALSKGEIKEDWNIIAWTDHQYCKHIIKYSSIVSYIGVSVTKSRRNIKFKILYHNYN